MNNELRRIGTARTRSSELNNALRNKRRGSPFAVSVLDQWISLFFIIKFPYLKKKRNPLYFITLLSVCRDPFSQIRQKV